jgi:hypothetical protein
MTNHKKITGGLVLLLLGAGIYYWTINRPPTISSRPPAQDAPHDAVGKVAPPVAEKQAAKQSPNAVSTPPRKFADMDVLEANAILKKIENMDHASIFQLWLDAGRVERDRTKQLSIGTVLASAMRSRTPTSEFLAAMRAFVADNANSTDERRGLVGLFNATFTRESIDFLIFVATELPENDLRQLATVGIGKSGSMRSGGGFHEERSPALEQLWRETHDPSLLNAAAVAMAQIGAPAAVESLLSSTLQDEAKDEARKRAALNALGEIYLDNAVPPIAALLAKQATASPVSALAGRVLVNIGHESANKALLSWLQNADDSAVSLAHEFVVSTRSPALLKAWNASLDQSVPFRSEKIRDAIRSGLLEHQQGRKLTPVGKLQP